MKKVKTTIFAMTLCFVVQAQSAVKLSLDSCRQLAIKENKELRMAAMKQRAAHYERRAAQTKYLPRVSASGAYLHTSRELSLLSGEQKASLSALDDKLGGLGSQLVEALHTDTRNMGAAAVMLSQPIYMGGKIVAYNRITRFAEQIARSQNDLALQNVIVEVDEAYWHIVALRSKKALAEGFLQLVEKLDSDVQQMIAEGIATTADGLSVRVKVNEAKVALIQVNNGLELSKMKLCQVCGLEMDTDVEPTDELPQQSAALVTSAYHDVQTAFGNRPELRALDLSTNIYKEKVNLARSEFLPSVALTGGYMASNPSLFDSFERQMKGMWSVGVVISVPIVTFGERCYKVKAARAEQTIANYELDETREKVELQVNQCRRKLTEASERLTTAMQSMDEADENLRHATLGMKEGVIPVSNVLEAQTAWLGAHSQCVEARVDVRLAEVYLEKAKGEVINFGR